MQHALGSVQMLQSTDGRNFGMKECLIRMLVVATLGISAFAHAAPPDKMTPNELSLLPRWCMDTQTFPGESTDSRAYHSYVARFGPGWKHMHHYCWALVDQMRLSRALSDKLRREHMVVRVLDNIDYVLQNSPPDFQMRPEIYIRRASVLRLASRYQAATETLEALVAEWPTSAVAYSALVEHLHGIGRTEDAKRVLALAETKVSDPQGLQIARNRIKAR